MSRALLKFDRRTVPASGHVPEHERVMVNGTTFATITRAGRHYVVAALAGEQKGQVIGKRGNLNEAFDHAMWYATIERISR